MPLILNEPNWETTLKGAGKSYYKLVLVVGPVGSGKSNFLKEASIYHTNYLNFGEEFARRLLAEPIDLRPSQAEEVAIKLVNEAKDSRLAIDNTEVLFEAPLQLNPLRLLKRLSINRLIIATWTGMVDDSKLTYGFKGHPAYREFRYTPQDNFTIVSTII